MHAHRRSPILLTTAALLLTVGCSMSNPIDPASRARNPLTAPRVPIPNAPAGDARARGYGIVGAEEAEAAAAEAAGITREEYVALATQRLAEAESLWNRAEALEGTAPEDAADLYDDVVADYPEYERAAEARFRQGRALFQAGEYADASRALQDYMKIVPVNAHLAEVEETIYESGRRYLARSGGLLSIFTTDDAGLDAYKFVAEVFPAGTFADDSLLALGDYYREDDDWATAALHYRELLQRYPDSEWSFRARLHLGDTYLARDQGDPYHAGFVDVDPRNIQRTEGGELVGPVKSAPELALEQYELFLERMALDRARQAEYATEVAYARERVQECRERLAAKDLHVADWFRAEGDLPAAASYYRSAATWTDTAAGRTAAQRLAAIPADRRGPVPGSEGVGARRPVPVPSAVPSRGPVAPPVTPRVVVSPVRRQPVVRPPVARPPAPPPVGPRVVPPRVVTPAAPATGYGRVPPPPPPPSWPANR